MSKLVLTGPKDLDTTGEGAEGSDVVEAMRLPPLRKFVVRRWNNDGGIEEILVTGHSIEPIGQNGIAIVEVKQVGDRVIQTFPRIFMELRDMEELETNALRIN